MIKVSVIVPIYNAEKYLKKCVDSLINQTLQEIEIILVNDGSQDKSKLICEDFEKKDKRIKIINKENGGVASARNLGLAIAQGEYIAFVDADDYVENTMYENMYNKVVNSSGDMCVCNFILHKDNKKIVINNLIEKSVLINNEIIEYLILNLIAGAKVGSLERMTSFRSPWIYLYKKEIIFKNKLTFNNKLTIGEDFLFNLKYMFLAKKIVIDEAFNYHYIINGNSLTQKYYPNYWDMHKYLINEIKNLISKQQLSNEYKRIFHQRINIMILSYFSTVVANEVKSSNKKNIFKKLWEIKKIMNDQIIKNAVRESYNNSNNLISKLYIIFLKYKISSVFYLHYRLYEKKQYKRY